MRLYFARHGESEANILRVISNRGLKHGLTRTGRLQAHELARRLENQAITHIFTSPVLRAIETCVILADHLMINYEVVEALREVDCGAMEGFSDEATWEQWHDLYDAWRDHRHMEERYPLGESYSDVKVRFMPFVDGLIQQHGQGDERIVCIGHGGLYRIMLPLVIQDLDLETFERDWLGYASCLVTEWTDGKLHVYSLLDNETVSGITKM
jgi:probable phosphoglycerate mutase